MVRSNELSFARRGALSKLAARRQGARPSVLTGLLVGLDPNDDSRVVVSFDGSEVSVLAGPQKLVPGTVVAVEVDSSNAPVRVTGPVTVRPEGLDADMPAPAPVTPMPELGPRELTEAEAQAIQDTADGLAETQGRVNAAEGLLDAIGASDGPDGVADAISDYLAIPLDQITIVDNRGADGNVIANLYDAIIVDGLLTASGVITKDLIATGAIESRHLNVVPEEGTGGMELKPEGLRIIPSEEVAGTTVSLRVDEDSTFSFAKSGEVTFSVSSEGDLVSRNVEATESFKYRSVELSTILNRIPLGLVAPVVSLSGTVELTTTQRGVMNVSIDENNTGVDRAVEVKARMELRNIQETLQLALYGANGSPVSVLSSVLGVQNEASFSHGRTVVEISKIMRVKPGEQWNVLAAAKSYASSTTNQVFFDQGTYMSAVDLGPWRGEDIQAGWTSGSSSGGSTAKTTYNDNWNSTGHRTYSYTSLSHTRAEQSLVQGAVSGTNSRGHWIFPDAAIRSALSGATVNSGVLIIRNQHTYSSSGMTAVVKTHAYSSAPSTFGTASAFTSVHVPKGGTVSIPLTPTILAGLKSGTVRGFSLDHGGGTSTANYGYYSPTATLTINYTK